MKLYGNNRGKKNNHPSREKDLSAETRVIRRDRDDEPTRLHTPQERLEIDRMIAEYQRRKVRKRIIICAIVLVLIAAGIILWKSFIRPPDILPTPTPTPSPQTSQSPQATSQAAYTRNQGVYTFALLGKDYEANLTDTILVGTFDTQKNTLSVVNIPRDTLINVKRVYKKANGMYSHNGYDMGKVKEELKYMLGYTVDSYIVVDIEAFAKIVNTIGGVDFDVPVNMDYDDPVQDFHVHVMAGMQPLDGETALGVVRFRQNNEGSEYGPGYIRADIDRIETQQAFMKTVAKKCLSIGNATKVNEFAQIFKDYVITDLSTGNMAWYGLQFLNLKSENIDFMTMPANYEDFALDTSCCVVELDNWIEMINTSLSPYKEKITADSLNVLTRNSKGVLYSTSGKINE